MKRICKNAMANDKRNFPSPLHSDLKMRNHFVYQNTYFVILSIGKDQLNSEWIYEVIVDPKIPTKNYRDFCPITLLEGMAEISALG